MKAAVAAHIAKLETQQQQTQQTKDEKSEKTPYDRTPTAPGGNPKGA
jgi:hypothetical protein